MEEENNLTDEIHSMVNECVEHLQDLFQNTNNYRAQPEAVRAYISQLLGAICSEKAMKHLASKSVGGLPILVVILEKTRDQHTIYMVVMVLKILLLPKSVRNERIRILVSCGALNHLLRIVGTCKLMNSTKEDFISSIYAVIARIGSKDRKLGLKARLCGVLPVIFSHVKTYANRPPVFIPVLMALKGILSSGLNATALCKDGLIPLLLSTVIPARQKMTLCPVYAMEAIAVATRTRSVARRLVQHDDLQYVLSVLEPGHWTSAGRRGIVKVYRLFRSTLQALVHVTAIKIGREALSNSQAIPSLLQWSKSFPETGENWNHLVVLASLIVQRCLPPSRVPVRHLHSPITFGVPSESCALTVPTHETNALGKEEITRENCSPTLTSSSHSISDSDVEEIAEQLLVEPTRLDIYKNSEHFHKFFDELKPPRIVKAMQAHPCAMSMSSLKLEEREFQRKHGSFFEGGFEKDSHSQSSLNLQESNEGDVRDEPNGFSDGDNSFGIGFDKIFSPGNIRRNSVDTMEDRPSSGASPTKSPSQSRTDKLEVKSASVKKNKLCFSPSQVRHLMQSAREENRSLKFLKSLNIKEIYERLASKTISVMPFVKIAYPDMKYFSQCRHFAEKLHHPSSQVMRSNIIKHAEQMLKSNLPYAEVYNLDSILSENISSNEILLNCDEKRIYSKIIPENLHFESRFESGNLRKVFMRGEREYDLVLNPDINSNVHHQWFYFEVSGMQDRVPYIFNIINMEKANSLFNDGMCPLMFSVRAHVEKKLGWMRTGKNVCYFRNHYIRELSVSSMLNDKPYYTLTFTITFPYSNDVCYIAYHYPYTYTTLQTQMYSWLNTYDVTQVYCKAEELCKTLAGNSVPLVTITAHPVNGDRPYVLLTARVHPGESNSSWAMKGTMDFLLCNKASAQRLREMYIFKVVPMLNPDGVINGCHRCSLTGQDLNRQWIIPNPKLHPTIHYTKGLVHYLNMLGRKPFVFCDYHGHSRRKNVFLYGCNPEQSWWSCDADKMDRTGFEALPILMNAIDPSFSLHCCSFSIERARESTARITLWRQFGVTLSYTMECTYGGFDQGVNAGLHVAISNLEDTGMKLCICLGKLHLGSEKRESDTILLKGSSIFRKYSFTTEQSSSSSQSDDDSYDTEDSG